MARSVQVACAALVLALVLVLSFWADASSERIAAMSDLTRDPTAVAGVPWWVGVVGRLNNLGWVVAATAALLAGQGSAAALRRPLLALGGVCALVAVDDTVLLHEEVLPSLGLPEELFLAAYAAAGVTLGVLWVRSPWRQTPVGLAFLAGATMLALSVVVDVFFTLVIVEDMVKLVGTVAWCFCGVWGYTDSSGGGVRSRPRRLPSRRP